MLFSGIHFNFSFDEEVLRREYEKKRNKTEYSDTFSHYKSSFYLELAAKMTKHSWLTVYLTAASPVMDGSFFCSDALGTDVLNRYASPRCSEIGYWNDFIPILRYENLKAYTDSIQAYVNDGQLKSPAELYYPVRLKPRGENSLKNLQNNGVDHIELQKRKVLYARERYAVRIREQFHSGYVKQGIALVKQYAEEIAKKNQEGIRECVNYLGFVQKSLWPSTNI